MIFERPSRGGVRVVLAVLTRYYYYYYYFSRKGGGTRIRQVYIMRR